MLGAKLIDERLAELKHQIETTGEAEDSFLASLLGEDKLSLEEVYGNVTELMAAAVDTVIPIFITGREDAIVRGFSHGITFKFLLCERHSLPCQCL